MTPSELATVTDLYRNSTIPKAAIILNTPTVNSNEEALKYISGTTIPKEAVTSSRATTTNTGDTPITTTPIQASKPKQPSDKPHYVPTWVDRDNEINARYAKMWANENQQEQPAQVVQPTEPVPVTNTRKPVQKSTGFTYMPMSTDQAVELYRRQHYNF